MKIEYLLFMTGNHACVSAIKNVTTIIEENHNLLFELYISMYKPKNNLVQFDNKKFNTGLRKSMATMLYF